MDRGINQERGIDKGNDRGHDRGNDRGNERGGFDQRIERGVDRGNDRDRDTDRDNRRGGERDRNFDDRDRRFNRSGGNGGGGGNDRNSFKSGRNTLEYRNQNRNKSSEQVVDKRGHPGGNNRNYSGDNKNFNQNYRSSSPGQGPRQQQHSYDRGNYNSEEQVETVSFTNSKLNSTPSGNSGNNNNRYLNGTDYGQSGRITKDSEFMDRGDRGDRGRDNQSHHQQQQSLRGERPITGRQQQQQQQLSSNSQRHQNTLLTTNHSVPISSSIISTSLNSQQQQIIHQQQLQHHQPIATIQPQPQQMSNEMLANNSAPGHHESNRPKRYSSLRQRTVDHPQNIAGHEMGMPIQLQDPNLLLQMPHTQCEAPLQSQEAQQNYSHKTAPPANYPMAGIEYNPQLQKAAPQQNVVQNVQPVVAPNQYQPNFYNPNEYGPQSIPPQQISSAVVGPQPPYGQPAPYIPSGPQTNPAYLQQPQPQAQPGATVAVVQPQMMNFVPTNLQAPPVVAPTVVPTFPAYPGVQNYTAAVSISFTNTRKVHGCLQT